MLSSLEFFVDTVVSPSRLSAAAKLVVIVVRARLELHRVREAHGGKVVEEKMETAFVDELSDEPLAAQDVAELFARGAESLDKIVVERVKENG